MKGTSFKSKDNENTGCHSASSRKADIPRAGPKVTKLVYGRKWPVDWVAGPQSVTYAGRPLCSEGDLWKLYGVHAGPGDGVIAARREGAAGRRGGGAPGPGVRSQDLGRRRRDPKSRPRHAHPERAAWTRVESRSRSPRRGLTPRPSKPVQDPRIPPLGRPPNTGSGNANLRRTHVSLDFISHSPPPVSADWQQS